MMPRDIVTLSWQEYRLFPYERELGVREIKSLLKPARIQENRDSVSISTSANGEKISRLTYFSSAETVKGRLEIPQTVIERASLIARNNRCRRQATRYSVHGLHDYKGKFNPQVARALLNILCPNRQATILDPFCGSGTTLVECAHLGLNAVGCDLNPLAVFIAKAKMLALCVPGETVRLLAQRIGSAAQKSTIQASGRTPRLAYLKEWFDAHTLDKLERLRAAIIRVAPKLESIFLACASDLLREYSLQEPQDLRIRRRKSPFPDQSIFAAFEERCFRLATNLADVQATMLAKMPHIDVLQSDAQGLGRHSSLARRFDGAITSPPYATALPYIDTQRLSLVWLGLVEPSELPCLQGSLIGSREFIRATRVDWLNRMLANKDGIPQEVHSLCMDMNTALSSADGFRRQATPSLLYRYCSGMRNAFSSVGSRLKKGAFFALIVGHNHTVLSGRRFDIDTPSLLSALATDAGFAVAERLRLQAYQRYGLHQRNAVAEEELLVLQKT